jgi:hypothetical protein
MKAVDALELELSAIDAEAKGEDPGAGPQPEPPKQEKPSTEAVLNNLLGMAIAEGSKKFPSIEPIWTGEKRSMFCGALGPLLDKYDVDAVAFFERYAVEIMAVVICVPMLYLTVQAIRLDLAAQSRGAEVDITPATAPQPDRQPAPAPVNEEGIPTR